LSLGPFARLRERYQGEGGGKPYGGKLVTFEKKGKLVAKRRQDTPETKGGQGGREKDMSSSVGGGWEKEVLVVTPLQLLPQGGVQRESKIASLLNYRNARTEERVAGAISSILRKKKKSLPVP